MYPLFPVPNASQLPIHLYNSNSVFVKAIGVQQVNMVASAEIASLVHLHNASDFALKRLSMPIAVLWQRHYSHT